MFSKEVEPENVTVLQCYPQLKEDYRDKLTEDIKGLRARMEEKNEIRVKKVQAFERSVEAAEKESEQEAFQMIRDFKSLKKKVLSQIDREETSRVEGFDELVKQLLEQLAGLENHLMANEIQLQESIEEALSEFEATIFELVQGMQDNGQDFFRRLEELEKTFFTGVQEGSTSEIDAYTQNQEMSLDNDTNKARFLGNREEMNQAIANFNESHMSLIQNKDDYMQGQMNNWKRSFFDKHRERQYHRNRQRIMDTRKVIEECRTEITAASTEGNDDDDNDDGR